MKKIYPVILLDIRHKMKEDFSSVLQWTFYPVLGDPEDYPQPLIRIDTLSSLDDRLALRKELELVGVSWSHDFDLWEDMFLDELEGKYIALEIESSDDWAVISIRMVGLYVDGKIVNPPVLPPYMVRRKNAV